VTFLPDTRVFVIAEAGVNHNGDLDLARQLVDAAAAAGADAVKFQSFRAETLASRSAPKANYQIAATGGDESQFEMLKRLELSNEAHRDLRAYCAARSILFLSTPFDEERADFLESLGMPAFKIPSGEITNLPFLAHIAAKRKPILLSTGMSDLTASISDPGFSPSCIPGMNFIRICSVTFLRTSSGRVAIFSPASGVVSQIT